VSRDAGARAERQAVCFLLSRGLRLLKRNFLCRFGEIDLLMEDHGTVAVVEVRARRSPWPMTAAESVGPAKQARILLATRYLLARMPHLEQYPIRFDVVAISGRHGDNSINWIRDAFRP
jgi:putative endonuclease